ncbi:hypothetical protein HR45_04550 [Shewanella mangrovi]|uniref:DUF2938 domain-containing protein n=1 Tax=Shewanella mangrovi TaxID=1515746 RepID=A0A094JHJ6_9GAMM|nr:DUF2938 family protein [Shewanella mangrovi]KFZ38697.1 hypothetical protein HR45_04550 [Shewanella mangrovi]
MENIILFCLLVGIGSTVILDIWVTVVEKVLGIPPTNWGIVGRWLLGIPKGKLVVDASDTSAPTFIEKALGWIFHYAIGIGYAVLIILFFGAGFIDNPTVLPIFVVGLVLSTLAGLAILMPGLGAGFMGRLLPEWTPMFIYLVVAHTVFSIGQYGFAMLFVYLN